MKKFLSAFLTVCLIVTSVAVFPMTISAEDANSAITVTDVVSLNQAIKDIANGGTITVDGEIVVPASDKFTFSSGAGKTYTITGGSFDFTALSASYDGSKGFVHVKDNVTFENTTFKFDTEKNDYLFANGYNLTIAETVIFEGAKVCFFNGAFQASSSAGIVNLLAGNYTTINCASHAKYTISNSIYVHVGGNATVSDILGNSGGCIVNGDVTVIVDGNASVNGVWGGGNGGTVNGNTYVTVGGNATAKQIYGGGNGGTINGSTFVTLKDNANPSHTVSTSDHSTTYAVYGGGKSNTVTGSTNVTIMDNAKSNYIFGGNLGTASIGEGSHVNIMGGAAYSVYGGSQGADHGSGSQDTDHDVASVIMTGGTVHQLFGGNEASSLTGNVTVKLLGGTVLRRVFGGCYNDYSTSISDIISGKAWKSSNSVIGKVNLFISENATLSLNSESDNALSAHSRRETVANDEIASIIYTSNAAKTAYSRKISAGSVSSGKTPNYTHCLDYTISDNVITQTCSCGVTATATITPNGNVYTGNEIGVSVVYSDNWEFEEFDITYANNVNVGTATATLSIEGITTQTYNYVISKNTVKAPTVYANNNQIAGLTTNMEYSDDGISYNDVTDADMTFADGVYYVRYKSTESNYASPAVKVYFGNSISANKVNTVQGGTVDIIVRIPVNTGVDNINVTLGYDNTALTLESFTAVDFAGVALEGNVITWSGNSTNKTGTLAKLTFTVNSDAALGSYAITLEANGFSVANGEIKVAEFVNGDVNGDGGKITSTDVVALRTAIAAGATQDLGNGADVDGNGIVNSNDLIVIRQYLANYDYDAGESSIVLGNDHE